MLANNESLEDDPYYDTDRSTCHQLSSIIEYP